MDSKEFTIEISGSNVICSRQPETEAEVYQLYVEMGKLRSQLMDDLVKDMIKKGIFEGDKDDEQD